MQKTNNLLKTLALGLALMASGVHAQDMIELWGSSDWTDGTAFYRATFFEGEILMSGGTCHEGGYAFNLGVVDAANGKYELKPYNSPVNGVTGDYVPLRGKIGSAVTRRTINGKEYLVVKDGGKVTDVLERMDTRLHTLLESDIKTRFKGVYEDDFYQQLVITPEYMALADISSTGTYQVMEEYETPSNIFELKSDEAVKYVRLNFTETGIDIYEMEKNEYDDFSNPRLLRSAQMMWNEEDGIVGRWPFTSTRVLTAGFLSVYPNKLLRLMRNEIMARHGYRFKSQELNEYFDREPWYMPGNPDNKVKLSEVEALNVELIKSLEAEPNRYFDKDDEGNGLENRQPWFSAASPGGVTGHGVKVMVKGQPVEIYYLEYDNSPVVTGYAVRRATGEKVLLSGTSLIEHSVEYREDGSVDGNLPINYVNLSEVMPNGSVRFRYSWNACGDPLGFFTWEVANQHGEADMELIEFPYGDLSIPEPSSEWKDGVYTFSESMGDGEPAESGRLELRNNADGSLQYSLSVNAGNGRQGSRQGVVWPEESKARICLGMGHTIALQNFGSHVVVYNHSISSMASGYTFGNLVTPVGCYIRTSDE